MKAFQKIPLSRIDLTDETFSVNFMPDLRRLRSSIEQIGLIQPVILRKNRNRFQIVCGFRRISVFEALGKEEIEARVFDENDKEEVELFAVSLHENLNTRGFNAVEKAIALDKLAHHFQIDRMVMIKECLPFFSLEPNEKILNTYLSLSRMEDEVKKHALEQEVSRSNIRKLSALRPEDRMALLPLFSSLKLGENRLRETLTLVEEISKRDRLRVKDIIGRPEIQFILSQKELTPSQKTEHIKKVLMDFRYPRMRELKEGFEKKRKALNLPSHVSLDHQPFFEGKGLKVAFQCETADVYRSMLSSLSELADRKEFKEMMEGVQSDGRPHLSAAGGMEKS